MMHLMLDIQTSPRLTALMIPNHEGKKSCLPLLWAVYIRTLPVFCLTSPSKCLEFRMLSIFDVGPLQTSDLL